MRKVNLLIAIAVVFISSMIPAMEVKAARHCHADGCNNSVNEEYLYCNEHKCAVSTCDNKKLKGSMFCSGHTCNGGRSGCYKRVASANAKCSTCKANAEKKKAAKASVTTTNKSSVTSGNGSAKKQSSSSKKTTSAKNSNSSKKGNNSNNKKTSNKGTNKKIIMPDCDDYVDYDDFMDEWDGCMPDGSDAEDYWENW